MTSLIACESPSMRYSTNNLPVCDMPHAQHPKDTSNQETTDLLKPNQMCTPSSTLAMGYREVVVEDSNGGAVYHKATELYNKYHKYSEL